MSNMPQECNGLKWQCQDLDINPGVNEERSEKKKPNRVTLVNVSAEKAAHGRAAKANNSQQPYILSECDIK